MTETVVPSVRIAAKRPSLKELRRRAIQTAGRASELLPRLIDRIEERIESMDDKQLVSAGHLLAGMAQQRAHVAKAAGLLRTSPQTFSGPTTIVNMQLRADMPLEERLRLIQQEVSGVPLIKPAEVLSVRNTPEGPLAGVEPTPSPGAASAPETPPDGPTGVPGGRPIEDRLLDL